MDCTHRRAALGAGTVSGAEPDSFCGGVSVEADRALNLLNDMLWNCLVIAAPLLAATLIIGVAISILQVATQLQEATLSYVPKLLVSAIILIALGPWMITRVTEFARSLYLIIPELGHF